MSFLLCSVPQSCVSVVSSSEAVPALSVSLLAAGPLRLARRSPLEEGATQGEPDSPSLGVLCSMLKFVVVVIVCLFVVS